MEIFKDIENYKGHYQISNYGNIKSLKNNKERIIKIKISKGGYYIVKLLLNKKRTTFNVHQLVAIAFLNHKPNGFNLVVNHINFIKSDNNISNLELITNRENTNQKHIKSVSKYVGVCWSKKSNKWKSSIRFNKSVIYLGLFDNEIDASNAYKLELSKII